MKILGKYLQVTVSFLPHFQHKHPPPAKEGLLSQEKGDCPGDRRGSAAVLCHSPWFFQNDAKAQKRQPALLFAENSMLICDSTWAKDLNFIMRFINFRVLEITYNITGSE